MLKASRDHSQAGQKKRFIALFEFLKDEQHHFVSDGHLTTFNKKYREDYIDKALGKEVPDITFNGPNRTAPDCIIAFGFTD